MCGYCSKNAWIWHWHKTPSEPAKKKKKQWQKKENISRSRVNGGAQRLAVFTVYVYVCTLIEKTESSVKTNNSIKN